LLFGENDTGRFLLNVSCSSFLKLSTITNILFALKLNSIAGVSDESITMASMLSSARPDAAFCPAIELSTFFEFFENTI
jgi:hypothetical protein